MNGIYSIRMTTSELTKTALKELDLMGFECWRQNQVRVPGRAFIGKKGLSDIMGFQIRPATGKFMLTEVKNKGDVLSEAQKDLLNTVKKAGGYCYIATVNENGKFILKAYESKPVTDRDALPTGV